MPFCSFNLGEVSGMLEFYQASCCASSWPAAVSQSDLDTDWSHNGVGEVSAIRLVAAQIPEGSTTEPPLDSFSPAASQLSKGSLLVTQMQYQ